MTELAAFSLGTLIGNLPCLLIVEGTLSAADTLMPRALREQRYEEVGRLAIRGATVCTVLLLPAVIPIWLYGSKLLMF